MVGLTGVAKLGGKFKCFRTFIDTKVDKNMATNLCLYIKELFKDR